MIDVLPLTSRPNNRSCNVSCLPTVSHKSAIIMRSLWKVLSCTDPAHQFPRFSTCILLLALMDVGSDGKAYDLETKKNASINKSTSCSQAKSQEVSDSWAICYFSGELRSGDGY